MVLHLRFLFQENKSGERYLLLKYWRPGYILLNQKRAWSNDSIGQEQHVHKGMGLSSTIPSLGRDPLSLHTAGDRMTAVCPIFSLSKQWHPVTAGSIVMPPPSCLHGKRNPGTRDFNSAAGLVFCKVGCGASVQGWYQWVEPECALYNTILWSVIR